MMNENECPIWGTPASRDAIFESPNEFGPGFNVDSTRAGGKYTMEVQAWHVVGGPDFDNGAKARLTTWLVDQRLGIESPTITPEIVKEAKRRRPLLVHERMDKLLRFLESTSGGLGRKIVLNLLGLSPNESPGPDMHRAWEAMAHTECSPAMGQADLDYLLDACREQGWITKSGPNNNNISLALTPKGYARIAELETKVVDSKQAFVAMWFDDSMNEARQAIKDGIDKAGYDARIIDEIPHNNKICDQIIAEIRRSRFLVADFTQGRDGARGGVYYEAGFAHGLNIPVIFTCQKKNLKKIHFDTRQYNHILWETPEDLRDKLAQRIKAMPDLKNSN